jgi:4-hydroxybenzoate polyprenyltransferase
MFPHTLFSIPFGVISMLIAAGGFPPFWVTFWIVTALISARTAANALNRLIDKDIDAKNKRTALRHMPAGMVSVKEASLLITVCILILAVSAFMLRPVCAMLLPVPIFLIMIYPYTKRFTWASHLVLGAASACAPIGAWIAVTGDIGLASIILGAAQMLWVSGFDIIYALLDEEHDREEGLHSIPAAFGTGKALMISSAFHAAAAMLLIFAGILSDFNWVYYIGIFIIAGLLLFEHIIVAPDDTDKITFASYRMNQIVSVVFLIFAGADILLAIH